MTVLAAMFQDLQPWLPLLLVPVAALIGAYWPGAWLPPIDRLLRHRASPYFIAIITACVIRYIWGSFDAPAVIHDEAAYLLQAAMLAHGQLVGRAPPIPEFFEQFHVFVTPVLAARYPPGFALALVPGIWLGLPGLIPVLLTGLTGGLLFALTRRLSTPGVALLAWLLWVMAPGNLRFRPTYLTESLSGLLWLAAWWSLLEWRSSGRRAWLLGLSVLIGWQAITRPLTAIAFAIPIGVCVIIMTWRSRRWKDLALAAGIGALCLSVIPYQNQVTTGNWRLTPLRHYSEVYFPFDLPGFGYDSTPPQRAWPVDFQAFAQRFSPMHRVFTPDRLPQIFWERSGHVLFDAWGRWRPALAILALLGVAAGGPALLFAALTCLLLIVTYLSFAHDGNWTVYYLETEAVLVVLAALGAEVLAGYLVRPRAADHQERRASLALGLLSLLVLFAWPRAIERARAVTGYAGFGMTEFRQQVARLPGPSIVFIRYSETHDVNKSLIANQADLLRAHAWLVYDRGKDNLRLMALAPDRKPYLYLEQKKLMVPLNPDGTMAASPASAR